MTRRRQGSILRTSGGDYTDDDDRHVKIAAILLAAGLSRRFGTEDKICADLGGIPLGGHAARTLASISLDARYVVTHGRRMDWAGLSEIENVQPEAGISRSLALGVSAAWEGGADAVIVALADMPLVPASHFERLITSWRGEVDIVASAAGNQATPPVIFGYSWFPSLCAMRGDIGAKTLLRQARVIALSDTAKIDVDRVETLVSLRETVLRA